MIKSKNFSIGLKKNAKLTKESNRGWLAEINYHDETDDPATTPVQTVIDAVNYTFNNIGQRTNATRNVAATNSTACGYDALGLFIQAVTIAAADNRYYESSGPEGQLCDAMGKDTRRRVIDRDVCLGWCL